ncbi:MAG: IS21 family transposase [Alphaproteobacteria bacterium]|nr:IS21 family transposase [Alphaproteobacteria bacterium]
MFAVEVYAAVRRFVFIEGNSRREAARVFGLSRETVLKMCRFSLPPGYTRTKPADKPKLGPLLPVIDAILEADRTAPVKQRHSAKRIFERLRDEHGFAGGYTVVKDYVRLCRARGRETFVPLSHPPGHAQVDFGEAVGVIGGVRQKIHFFCMDLPQSDTPFVKAYPRETTEAFLDGHVSAFTFFGGVPQSILYDNTTIAVAKILGDGKRERTRAFTELVSHYLFADRFGRPGKGNDKGKVEGLVGYCRRNFLVPMPRFQSFDGLNAHLEACCRKRWTERLRGHDETIGERLGRDGATLRQLPATPYDACDKRAGRVSSLSLVRYRGTDYSVPTRFGHCEVLVRGYVHEVVISHGAEVIARHPRSYEHEDFIFNPLHYLSLLEQKSNALDQAAPLNGWELPPVFGDLRRLLEARMGKKGKREYVQVLRLLETFPTEEVRAAVSDALQRGVIGFDAIKHLVLCRIERRPPRLNLMAYPYLPRAEVATTSARAYMGLLAGTPS